MCARLEEARKGRPEDRVVIQDLRRTVVAKDAALDRLRASPRPQDQAALQQLKDTLAEHEATIAQLQEAAAAVDQLKVAPPRVLVSVGSEVGSLSRAEY